MEKDKNCNLHHSRDEKQREKMRKAMDAGLCPFCSPMREKLLEKEILFENRSWLLTYNESSYEGSTLHLLIIYKTGHVESPLELSPNEWKALHEVLSFAERKFNYKGGTFMMRHGDTDYTGATISHLHAHIVVGVSREEAGGEKLRKVIAYKNKP